MRSLIRNGAIYDLLYRHQTTDITFYVEKAKEIGGPVLELCCGTGRITIPTHESGISIIGLDNDEGMLAEARQKNSAITWIQGDATNFNMDRKFKLITAPFNSIQLFTDRNAIKSFFKCVHRHLEKGGYLIFDIFNPKLQYLTGDPVRREDDNMIIDPETGETLSYGYECRYDDATQINHVTLYFSKPGHPDFFNEKLEQRCFFPQEIDMIVEMNGLKIISKFGDFGGKEFRAGDSKQSLVCQIR